MIKNSPNPDWNIADWIQSGSFVTPYLTLTNVEAKTTDNSYILKLTFAEDIQYHDEVSNIMYFLPLAENENKVCEPSAEAFFYFITKLNQRIQIPVRRSWIDEQNYRFWVLSDEIIEEIKVEKNKWEKLGYNDLTDWNQGNKMLVDASKKQNWTDIHKDFGDRDYSINPPPYKTYQQSWEKRGLTYQDAQEWIKAGLTPYSYKFASHLKQNNITSQKYTDYKNSKSPQEQLNYFYANKSQVKWIDLNYLNSNQPSELVIAGYPNLKEIYGQEIPNLTQLTITNCPQLERIDIRDSENNQQLILNNLPNLKKLNCRYNNLTTLDLSDFANLEEINCRNNQLTEIKLPKGEKLEWLNLSNNNLNQDLSFLSGLVSLKTLELSNNPFYGSLEPLKRMSKLETLSISDTDIDSGLEYLPESVRKFNCSADERKDAKVKVIEEEWEYFKDIKKCKEFRVARKWLDENYPENEACKRQTDYKGWDDSYGWNNKDKKRADITQLDISKQELKGGLWLKGFTKLEKLNCSNNQLTDLDLKDCPELTELKCDNNEFHDLNFLKDINKLEKLLIQNNQKLSDKNLNLLTSFVNLKKLDISNSTLRGSLKPLANLKELEWLDISNTEIKEGLEYLPKSIKNFYCELDYQHGSVEIAKELSKFSESNEESNHTKYNLDKWRTDQANKTTSSIIPLERLFVIRGNIKQFVNKWGKKTDDKVIELSKLQSPEQYSKYRYLGGVKWIARGAAVTGGVLALTDRALEGGSLAAASPFIDAIASHIEDNYYSKREDKWKEFLNDADMLLDNYHELLGILKKLGTDSKVGKVNQALKDLDTKTKEFLKEYDADGNEEIDINELIAKRQVLTQDLTKDKDESKLQAMVESIKHLEDIVVNYQKNGSLIEEEPKKENTPTESTKPEKTKLYQQIKEEVEKIKKEEQEKKEKQKSELEAQLKEEENKHQQIKDKLDNLLFLEKKRQLTNEELNLLKGLEKALSKAEKEINKVKDNIEKQLTRNKFANWEDQIGQTARNLVSPSYWGNKVNQGWESTKQGVSNTITNTKEFLKDSLTTSIWYWEQWKERSHEDSYGLEQLFGDEQQESENQTVTIQEANSEQKAWKSQDFTEEQTKQWIEAGLTVSEANFAAWLRDIKSKDLENFSEPQWIKEKIAIKELNLNELRQAYEQESKEVKIDMQTQIIQPPKGGNN